MRRSRRRLPLALAASIALASAGCGEDETAADPPADGAAEAAKQFVAGMCGDEPDPAAEFAPTEADCERLERLAAQGDTEGVLRAYEDAILREPPQSGP